MVRSVEGRVSLGPCPNTLHEVWRRQASAGGGAGEGQDNREHVNLVAAA